MLKRTKLCTSLMIAFGSGVAVAPALAQQTPPPPAQQLERVEITGSSIKRIDAETALPVQIITREQIQKSGATNVEQLLQTISAISSSQGLTAASASGATTGGISAVGLRGLSSLRTLVLLNGRRIAPYGIGFTGDSVSVDVNSIPLSAIERVEVLKDGASAIYGSDAIAGVINFILRQEFKGLEITGEYGNTTQGGADFKRISALGGFGNLASDRFNVMISGSYQKEGSLFGRDRNFANTDIRPFEGNDTTSGNTFPANIATYDPVTGQIGAASRNPTAPGCPGPYAVNDPLFPPNRCRFDPASLVTLVPATERTSIFGSAKFAITPDIQLYAEGSYNQNKARTIIQPVPLSDQFAIPGNNPLCQQAPYNNTSSGPCQAAIVLTPASPFYPTAYATSQFDGTPDLVVRYRASLSGNRDFTDISEAPRVVGGVKGTVANWDFDVAALYSESKVREQVNNGYPAYTKIMPILNSGNVNFFGDNTQAIQDQIAGANFTGDAFTIKSSLTSLSAKASRDLFQLPAGPLGFAIGAEARKEKYDFSANPTIQTGDISGYGGNFLNLSKSRNVNALFSEVNVPIVKNLEANFSARYDHYEGIGSSTVPKASLRWQPVPQVLLRTSFGQGFRAPSLQDLYAQNTQSVTPNGVSDPLRCSPPLANPPPGGNSPNDCLTQFGVTFGGNQNLKPEKSNNFTLGTVLEPVNNVSIGIDYFRIRLDDQITNGVDAATILSDPVKYAALITRGPPDPAQPGLPGHITNLLETNLNLGIARVAGFDFDVKWRIPADEWGKFTVSGTATYMSRYDTSNLDGTYSGNINLPNTSSGGLVPRFKSYLSVDWTRGPWSANLAQSYQNGYHDVTSNATGVDRDVKCYVIYDLQGTYEATKSWRITLGAKNLFDTNPPYTNQGTSFQAGYDPQYADPRGRFIYGRVTYVLN
jgi:iron complex outermembrane receptor protein